MPIQDYSTDPDLNVQISGINIAEGCPPSGINNAIRQLMADVKVESEAKAEAITAVGEALSAFAATQASKDDEQDEAIAEALDKVGLPLGFEYTRLTGQTAPLGGVDYMGQTATRAMYADLWAWLQANKPDAIVSEAEWQTMYASQNGNVPYYSTGDGSTTFRFPRVVGYFKGAGAVSEVGQYIKEGLPNITGSFSGCDYASDSWTEWTGAFKDSGRTGAGVAAGAIHIERITWFDASLSNPAYGNSQHVTPETVTVVMGVIAFSSVASIGEATEEGIVAELGEHGAKLGEYGAKLGELEAEVDAANQGLVGVVRTVNGVAADAAGNVDVASQIYNSTQITTVEKNVAYTLPAGGTWKVIQMNANASSGMEVMYISVYTKAGGSTITPSSRVALVMTRIS